METASRQDLSASASQARENHFGTGGAEPAIQACYDLLSSGSPLSDILVAVQRLGSVNKDDESQPGVKPGDTEFTDIAGEGRSASPQWQTAPMTQPVRSRLWDNYQNPSGALVRTGRDVSSADRSHSLVALPARPSRSVDNRSSDICSWLIGAVLFWLIPASSLTIIGIAGELLIHAGLPLTPREATEVLKAMPAPVESGKNLVSSHLEIPEASAAPDTPHSKPPEPSTAVPGNSEASRTAPDMKQKRPAAVSNLAPVTGRRRLAPPRQIPIEQFSMGWKIPSRLTDGF